MPGTQIMRCVAALCIGFVLLTVELRASVRCRVAFRVKRQIALPHRCSPQPEPAQPAMGYRVWPTMRQVPGRELIPLLLASVFP